MSLKTKDILRGIFCGGVTLLIVTFTVMGCVNSKPVKAEEITNFNTNTSYLNLFINTGELRQFGESSDHISYTITDKDGYAMQFKTIYQNGESFYYNKNLYIRITCEFWDTYFMSGTIDLFNNNKFNGSPIRSFYYYDNGGTAGISAMSDDDYKAFNSGLVSGGYYENEYYRGVTMESDSMAYKLFSVFFRIQKASSIQNMEEYNRGYRDGVSKGEYDKTQDIINNPHNYGLYNYEDTQDSYRDGLATGEEGVAKSTNWFTGIFTGLSQVFSIKIFGGSITLGMLCMIPFAIEFVFVIFKIIRGGD